MKKLTFLYCLQILEQALRVVDGGEKLAVRIDPSAIQIFTTERASVAGEK